MSKLEQTSPSTSQVDSSVEDARGEMPNEARAVSAEKESRAGGASRIRRLGKRLFKPANPAFTVGLLVVFVAIIAVVVYFIMTVGSYAISDPIYRYNSGVQDAYEGDSRVFRAENGDIVTFTLQNNGETIELTEPRSLATSPLYWQEEERFFLPAMMSVVQPADGIAPVRTGFYTEIRRDDQGFIARVDNKDILLENGFLFDGQSVYVFLEDVTVDYLGTHVDLPAMSYAIIVSGLRVELYPYGGEPIVEQTGLVSVSAEGEGFLIDMTNDVLQTNGEQVLLFTTPSILDVITQ